MVEFDIFTNPGVDPGYPHVGIDIGSNVSKKKINAGTALIRQEVTARINYEEATKVIVGNRKQRTTRDRNIRSLKVYIRR